MGGCYRHEGGPVASFVSQLFVCFSDSYTRLFYSFHDGSGYGDEKWGCHNWAPVQVYRGLVTGFNSEAVTWPANFQFVKSCRCRRRPIGQSGAAAPSRGTAEVTDEYEYEFDEPVDDDELTGDQSSRSRAKQIKQVNWVSAFQETRHLCI
jgi:hypothetical protein